MEHDDNGPLAVLVVAQQLVAQQRGVVGAKLAAHRPFTADGISDVQQQLVCTPCQVVPAPCVMFCNTDALLAGHGHVLLRCNEQ